MAVWQRLVLWVYGKDIELAFERYREARFEIYDELMQREIGRSLMGAARKVDIGRGKDIGRCMAKISACLVLGVIGP